nr:response regulator transcription factor [Bradyrhizobium diazoefficiens]
MFDARPLRGEWLACWLRSVVSKSNVLTFQSVDTLLDCLRMDGNKDLVLFSVCESVFPEVLSALDRFISMSFSIPSVVVSSEGKASSALEFLSHGARGFIPTNLDVASALNALDFIAAGGTFLPANLFLGADPTPPPSATARENGGGIADDDRGVDDRSVDGANGINPLAAATFGAKTELTDREAKVLECLCRGKPNKLIAHELGLSESTVKMYLGRLMRKVKTTNRTELALFGERLLKDRGLSGIQPAADAHGLSVPSMPSNGVAVAPPASKTSIFREPQKVGIADSLLMCRERVGSRYSGPQMPLRTSPLIVPGRLLEDAKLGKRVVRGQSEAEGAE